MLARANHPLSNRCTIDFTLAVICLSAWQGEKSTRKMNKLTTLYYLWTGIEASSRALAGMLSRKLAKKTWTTLTHGAHRSGTRRR